MVRERQKTKAAASANLMVRLSILLTLSTFDDDVVSFQCCNDNKNVNVYIYASTFKLSLSLSLLSITILDVCVFFEFTLKSYIVACKR